MKKTLFIIATIVLAVITYFIGKSKGWWNLFSPADSSNTVEKKSSNTKLNNKIRNLDSSVNEYGVDLATIMDNWDGKTVYEKKDGKTAQKYHSMAIGFLEDGTMVYKYKIYGEWVYDTEPFTASYTYNYNEYGVDTNTILAIYAGNDIYAYKMDISKTSEYGYLYDGRPVYKQGEYYQW
ncbi:hypothetical protein [Flectobacillus longus]|uniref:hypothetical protein n=1 Tax=Flectobacillus longus TaxID=2984207 RepID=UPI0024B77BA2|nr:hypothetical protein [Flectobacillus longus]MDI9880884.1 hypothetical protein [Flectobacillus longus]